MISVLLPTIRPHLIRRCLESIEPAAAGVPYEVVVVSDVEDPDEYTGTICHQWILRPRRGVVDAVNVACAVAKANYWFLFNDESTLDPGALKLLYGEAVKHPDEIVSPRHVPAFPFVYYGLPFVPFPFAHRKVLEQLGGLLDPAYRGFYADPDLSMRAHAAGVPIRIIDAAVIRHNNRHDQAHHESVAAYLAADRATFRGRWDHLGEFRDP